MTSVRQIRDEPNRRWFQDEDSDLVVWIDDRRAIVGFQLGYDKIHDERALTWHAGCGFLHSGVDSGEGQPGRHKAAPLLAADGAFDAETVASAFLGHCDALDATITHFIHAKLLECQNQ